MKCSGENVILCGMFHVASCFPLHFMLNWITFRTVHFLGMQIFYQAPKFSFSLGSNPIIVLILYTSNTVCTVNEFAYSTCTGKKRMCRIAVLRSWSRSEPRVFGRIRSRNFWLIKTLKRTFEANDELWAKSRSQSRRNSKTWSRRRQKTLGFATLPRIGSNQCELHFALVRFRNAVSVAVLWSTPDKFRNTVSVTVLCMVITRHV